MNESPRTFKVNKKTRWGPTIFLSIWTLGLIGMIGVFVYDLTTTPSRIDGFALILIIMVLIAFLALNYLSWQLRGQETLTFNVNEIAIINRGVVFGTNLQITYLEVDSINVDEVINTPVLLRFWGIGGGKIKIEYLWRNIRFGQDLTLNEAKTLAKEMEQELIKRKNAITNYNT